MQVVATRRQVRWRATTHFRKRFSSSRSNTPTPPEIIMVSIGLLDAHRRETLLTTMPVSVRMSPPSGEASRSS